LKQRPRNEKRNEGKAQSVFGEETEEILEKKILRDRTSFPMPSLFQSSPERGEQSRTWFMAKNNDKEYWSVRF